MTYARTMAMAAAVFALAACGGGGAGRSAPPEDSAGTTAAAPVSAAADSAPQPTGGAVTVSFAGIGPVRVGMTPDEVRGALGGEFQVEEPEASSSCQHARSAALPPGVKVMLVDGRVARVEVDSGSAATAEGARVGSSEAEVRRLYAGRLQVQPHKYQVGARYLIVTPASPADSARRILFEVDRRGVARYRAGKTPQVEWVEGCA